MNTTAAERIGGHLAFPEALADLTKWSVCISSSLRSEPQTYTLKECDTKEEAWDFWRKELSKDIDFATDIRRNMYTYEHGDGTYTVEIIAGEK